MVGISVTEPLKVGCEMLLSMFPGPLLGRLAVRKLTAASFVALALLAAPASAQTAGKPEEWLQSLSLEAQGALVRVDRESVQSRAAFAALVERNFALDVIGQYVLSASWEATSTIDRERFRILFKSYIVQTYAARMNDLTGRFEIKGAKPFGKRDILVNMVARIIPGLSRQVDWRIRELEGRYRVLDIYIDGLSMALILHDEFTAAVKLHGFEGLMAILDEKVQFLIAENE